MIEWEKKKKNKTKQTWIQQKKQKSAQLIH